MKSDEKILIMLGEIKGELTGVNKRLGKLDKMDDRLRKVEIDAAKTGAVSGGFVAVGVTLLVEAIRQSFKQGG
jgi:hypothetical protein